MLDIKNYSSTGLIPNILLFRKDIIVRTTTPNDWLFIDSLMKEEASKIGFLTKRVWEKDIWKGERAHVCLICEVNKFCVGYVFFSSGRGVDRDIKIQQIVIKNDARRFEYGTALCDCCVDFCKQFNRSAITLRCRADLEANNFWQFLGFKLYKIISKGTINHVGMKASNDIFCYRKQVSNDLFDNKIEYIENCSITRIFENANLSLLD